MNKTELQKLLAAINEKKAEVENFVSEDKLDEAKNAKSELVNMQAKFDLMKDMIEVEPEPENLVPAAPEDHEDPIHAFADAVRTGFRNEATYGSEGKPADGGYAVPEDIQTEINRYKEANFSLASLVDHENVTTMSGRRTFLAKGLASPFSLVAEAGKIGQADGPKFEAITYTIKKYAGYFPITNELLADSDQAIVDTIIEWLGKGRIATENSLILALLQGTTELKDIDGIKKAINVDLGQAYKNSVKIVTNDDGLNYFDTLKDTNGNYRLKPMVDPNSPLDYTLAVGATRVPIVVVPNAIMPSNVSVAKKRGIPMICGDLAEAVKTFDRQQISILPSNTASIGTFNAYEQDMTLYRGIMRLDTVAKDKAASVGGVVTIDDATVTGA